MLARSNKALERVVFDESFQERENPFIVSTVDVVLVGQLGTSQAAVSIGREFLYNSRRPRDDFQQDHQVFRGFREWNHVILKAGREREHVTKEGTI